MTTIFRSLTLIILLTVSNLALASGENEKENSMKLLSQKIKPVITEALVKAELSHIDTYNKTVIVYAKISQNLFLEVVDVRSENPVLSNYVKQQLNNLSLREISYDFGGETIKIPVEFKD